jgi:hypothetical protein
LDTFIEELWTFGRVILHFFFIFLLFLHCDLNIFMRGLLKI